MSVSGGQTIAGEAAFADGKLGDCKGSSSVTLSFGEEGVALPSQSNDTDVFAAMVLYPADLSTATVSIVYKFADGSVYLQTKSGKTLTPGHTLRLSTQIAKSDCKSSGAFFMTEAGVAEELPTEPIGYLKVVTLGESTLSAEELTSIAGNLANGAVIAFCGPIGFIGLAVPHVARILFADADHRILVPASILTGIVVMLLCDVLAKLLTFPINTITALLGIPIVIWVVIRNKSIV